ncbi:hypothetical protein HK105_202991 [Polyrhizophydium stewartii]|uniref:Uncharacterized protein n=1 Tax=Polyrhizophydium stewartii TaxID=2732419 RepID=A0ABR4NCT0_9FUNG
MQLAAPAADPPTPPHGSTVSPVAVPADDGIEEGVRGPDGQVCQNQRVLDLVLKSYVHLKASVFRGGANGRIKSDYMICECRYDPARDPISMACGEDSDCINRELALECSPEDCPTGAACQNRRFQDAVYMPIQVFQTERKGLGLRALCDIPNGAFIIEYTGEVISTELFRKRTLEYSKAGARHFYFMSLKRGEYIDASKRGNISRFINHSCAPNCSLQKWVVGTSVRMGIFAIKDIKRGVELTFDYKTKAQPCYCGEPVCKGFIGGSRDEMARSNAVSDPSDEEVEDAEDAEEAEQVDEDDAAASAGSNDLLDVSRDEERDGDYDDALARPSAPRKPKQPKKKKTRKPKPVKEARPIASAEDLKELLRLLFKAQRPDSIITLLNRVLKTEDVSLLRRFIANWGLEVIKVRYTQLENNNDVVHHFLLVLKMLPITTRNTVEKLLPVLERSASVDALDENTKAIAKECVERWQALPTVYKIPKRSAQPESTRGVGTPPSQAQSESASRGMSGARPSPGPRHHGGGQSQGQRSHQSLPTQAARRNTPSDTRRRPSPHAPRTAPDYHRDLPARHPYDPAPPVYRRDAGHVDAAHPHVAMLRRGSYDRGSPLSDRGGGYSSPAGGVMLSRAHSYSSHGSTHAHSLAAAAAAAGLPDLHPMLHRPLSPLDGCVAFGSSPLPPVTADADDAAYRARFAASLPARSTAAPLLSASGADGTSSPGPSASLGNAQLGPASTQDAPASRDRSRSPPRLPVHEFPAGHGVSAHPQSQALPLSAYDRLPLPPLSAAYRGDPYAAQLAFVLAERHAEYERRVAILYERNRSRSRSGSRSHTVDRRLSMRNRAGSFSESESRFSVASRTGSAVQSSRAAASNDVSRKRPREDLPESSAQADASTAASATAAVEDTSVSAALMDQARAKFARMSPAQRHRASKSEAADQPSSGEVVSEVESGEVFDSHDESHGESHGESNDDDDDYADPSESRSIAMPVDMMPPLPPSLPPSLPAAVTDAMFVSRCDVDDAAIDGGDEQEQDDLPREPIPDAPMEQDCPPEVRAEPILSDANH